MTIAYRPGPHAAAADLLDPPYADDPVGWVADRLGTFLWSAQREILESVRDNRKTAVHSSYLSGKSFVAGRAVCWWIDQHMSGEAFAVTTAPTDPQVKGILWKEIARAHLSGSLRGRVLTREWKLRTPFSADEELVAM